MLSRKVHVIPWFVPPALRFRLQGQFFDDDGQMLPWLFLASLSHAEPQNFTDIVLGQWNFSMFELDDDEGERTDLSSYIVTLVITKNRDQMRGDIIRETSTGGLVVVGKIGFNRDADSHSFWFLFSDKPEANSLASMTKVSLEPLGRIFVVSGRLNDGRLFSARLLSPEIIEITLYDTDRKKILMFRGMKQSVRRRAGFWTLTLPLLPFLLLEGHRKWKQFMAITDECEYEQDMQASEKEKLK